MDNENWLIPYLIKTLSSGGTPNLTAAEQFWDYIYIEDAAAAICAVMEHDDASGIFNLGSGNAGKLKELILKIKNHIDPSLAVNFGAQSYRSDQVMYLEADISKLQSKTGWHPVVNLDEGVERTVKWFLENKT
jgi:nucleoside-diphosphate-sugar epimerase